MNITLQTTTDLNTFEGINSKGQTITLGNGTAVGPMEALLMAAAGCSTIDVIMILEKMRQGVKDVKVEVEGKRRDEIPKTFTHIHLHYMVYGDVKDSKVKQAVDSSLEKYCSVSIMLGKAAEITSSYEIIEE